jgi:hypothetical protein
MFGGRCEVFQRKYCLSYGRKMPDNSEQQKPH